jgi:hypothetical protein
VIVYLVEFIENCKNSPHFWDTFSTVKLMHYFWGKNGLGKILGRFFTKYSGHPGYG